MLCYTVAVLEIERRYYDVSLPWIFLSWQRLCWERIGTKHKPGPWSIITPISICKLILFLLTLYTYNPLFVRDFEEIFSLFRWIRSEKMIFFHSLFHWTFTNNNMLSAFVQLTVGKGRSGSAWLTNIFTLLFMLSLPWSLAPLPQYTIHIIRKEIDYQAIKNSVNDKKFLKKD